MPTYWGDILLSNDGYNPVPTYSPTSASTGVPATPAPSATASGPATSGMTIRELRRLFPDQTRRELLERFPTAGPAARIPDSTRYFSQINPMYTQAQPMDSFAPMRMFQQFQNTGQMPGATPASPAAPVAGGSGYTTGGGK